MRTKALFCIGIGLILSPCFSYGETEDAEAKSLASSQNAQSFFGIGKRLYSQDAEPWQERAALVFMNAASDLDPMAGYALEDLIDLRTRLGRMENKAAMQRMLMSYIRERPSADVARGAVRFLLEDLNSREERESFLRLVHQQVRNVSAGLASDVMMELGLLAAERGDLEGAKNLFLQAYSHNPFNRLAYTKMAEVARQGSLDLSAGFYASQMRLTLAENPLDGRAAFELAEFAERLGAYELAARSYEYSWAAFSYMNPGKSPTAAIYRPLALNSFNSVSMQRKCQSIADELVKADIFDAVVEGIAYRAAIREENEELARRISSRVAAHAEKWRPADANDATGAVELAWYYSFAEKDAAKAIAWANRANEKKPSEESSSLMAYAMVMMGETELADSILSQIGKGDQIAAVARGKMALAADEKPAAVEAFRAAVIARPGSLEAIEAREALKTMGIVLPDENAPQRKAMLDVLANVFGENILPEFVEPGQLVSLSLTTNTEQMPFHGGEMRVQIVITNTSRGPLVIRGGALLEGNISVDASFSGDIEASYAGIVGRQVTRTVALRPGESMMSLLDVNVGGIFRTLSWRPQANVRLELTAHMDAVTMPDGAIGSRIGLAPAKTVVLRDGVKPTREYVSNRLEALSKGLIGQKIQSVRLFAGLLEERLAASRGEIDYQMLMIDPALLRSAVARGLKDENWTVKMQTMVGMTGLPMDFELTASVADNLQSRYWPVRLMSVYLLGTGDGDKFGKVLEWYSANDRNANVRAMAEILLERHSQSAGDAVEGQ